VYNRDSHMFTIVDLTFPECHVYKEYVNIEWRPMKVFDAVNLVRGVDGED